MQNRVRKGGRPTRSPQPGERVPMSFRVTPELKEKIDRVAGGSGRSVAQEIEIRLEQSFRDAASLDQAIDLAYGPRLAVLLAVMARAMNEIGRHAEFPANWMARMDLIDEAAAVVAEAVAAYRFGDR